MKFLLLKICFIQNGFKVILPHFETISKSVNDIDINLISEKMDELIVQYNTALLEKKKHFIHLQKRELLKDFV